MPSDRATHPAPSCLMRPIGRQSLHQAKPGQAGEGVAKAALTAAEWQQQHLRGRAARSALERPAASPSTCCPTNDRHE
eukprot:7795807-Alexandrium_andersonii.AAC.1